MTPASGQTPSDSPRPAKPWLLLLEAFIGTIAISAIASTTPNSVHSTTAQSQGQAQQSVEIVSPLTALKK